MIISDINYLQDIISPNVQGGDGWYTHFFSELEDLLAPLDALTPHIPHSPNGHFASVISTTYQGGQGVTHSWNSNTKRWTTERWTFS